MDLLVYPNVEEIQYYNTIAIEMFRKSKHDEAKTINVSYIEKTIEKVKNKHGNLYDKVALMLSELTQIHAFEMEIKELPF